MNEQHRLQPAGHTVEFTLPFSDLNAGGKVFAKYLHDQLKNDDVLVLGMALGGVPVAYEVAQKFHAPFDLLFIRRLLTPRGPGSQSCAITVAGSLVLDEDVPLFPAEPVEPLHYFLIDAIGELKRRTELCRGSRPPLEIRGKNILLVDCGIRTGLNMQAAVGALRQLQANRIIAAAPVVAPESIEIMEALADDFIYLAAPPAFANVAAWFKNFNRPSDESVAALLATG
jgi:putative phosphoribosyl transferase